MSLQFRRTTYNNNIRTKLLLLVGDILFFFQTNFLLCQNGSSQPIFYYNMIDGSNNVLKRSYGLTGKMFSFLSYMNLFTVESVNN